LPKPRLLTTLTTTSSNKGPKGP